MDTPLFGGDNSSILPKKYARAKAYVKGYNSIFAIKQGKGESIKKILSRFTRVSLEIHGRPLRCFVLSSVLVPTTGRCPTRSLFLL